MTLIAIEQSLHNIESFLKSNGIDVVGIGTNAASRADAFVISGMDRDVMGMAEATTGVPVINAQGKTAQQVLHDINHSV